MLSVEEITKVSSGVLKNGDKKTYIKSYCIDSRIIKQGDFFIPLVGERVDAHDYILDCVKQGAAGFYINSNNSKKSEIIDQSIKINSNVCIVEVQDSEKALYDIGTYNRIKHIDMPIVAVTGSVGKTTTREMIATVLQKKFNVLKTHANYNSLIGVPFMLLKLEDQDICVIEAGISEFGEMEKLSFAIRPDVAVITNIGTSHIGNFKSQENIFAEKSKIFKYLKPNGNIVINIDDKFLKQIVKNKNDMADIKDINDANIKGYSMSDAKDIVENQEGIEYKTHIYNKETEIKLSTLGNHNIYNSLCAIKVAEFFDVDIADIQNALENYINFERRMQKITLKNGCVLIDDAYNASYDSVLSGLSTINALNFKTKIVVIGDILEQGEKAEIIHRKIGQIFKNISVDYIFAIGNDSKYIIDEVLKFKKDNVFLIQKSSDIYAHLERHIKPDTVVYFKASNLMNFKEIVDKIKQDFE